MKISITLIIVIITSAISIAAFSNRNLFRRLLFNAYDIKKFKNYYRLFTYSLVHADWVHLLINMFVLFSFGKMTETYYKYFFGNIWILYYLLLYIGAVLISILPAYKKHYDDYSYNAVGASGAVSAVVFASIIFDPLGKIFIFPIPIGIPSILFAILYLAYSWYMNKKANDNIGHDAHFWGAIFGFVYTILLKPKLVLFFIDRFF